MERCGNPETIAQGIQLGIDHRGHCHALRKSGFKRSTRAVDMPVYRLTDPAGFLQQQLG